MKVTPVSEISCHITRMSVISGLLHAGYLD